MRVPWTARRSNQSILLEINPEYSLEGLMSKLKLQYFGHMMGRTNTLMLGKTEDKRRGQQRMRWLDSIINSMDMNLSKFWEIVKDRGAWHAAVHGTQSWTQLSKRTTRTTRASIIISRHFPIYYLFSYQNMRPRTGAGILCFWFTTIFPRL